MASNKMPDGTQPAKDLSAIEIKANMTSGGNAAFHNYALVNHSTQSFQDNTNILQQ